MGLEISDVFAVLIFYVFDVSSHFRGEQFVAVLFVGCF